MAPPLVRDTPVDKRVPGTINDADLWTERIEQQPKNNQERKKREAGIDELHRISPMPSISCENDGKRKARADAHPCSVSRGLGPLDGGIVKRA